MLRGLLIDVAQNPKTGMAIGGTMTSAGAAVNWLDIAKEWIGTGSIVIGVALSIAALIAQIVRIRNDRNAEIRAQAADRRAEEMHRAQIEAMRNARSD